VFREPLVHVLLLGVALFALHRWVAPPGADAEILVTADLVAGMRQDFQRRTGRPPTVEEEVAAIDKFVDDEVAVREALAMGLDRGDVIVRRRLIQKMEFLLENVEPLPDPSDADLSRYLSAHAARYATPARVSFVHVFAATQAHGEESRAVAEGLRTALVSGGDPSRLGDPFLRGREMRLQAETEIANAFGPAFAAAVMGLPDATWSEPIRSSFGWHVVRIDDRRPGAAPSLAAVRARVERDWREDRRQVSNAEARQRLRTRYVVRREGPGA
jgi:hypothetical protein